MWGFWTFSEEIFPPPAVYLDHLRNIAGIYVCVRQTDGGIRAQSFLKSKVVGTLLVQSTEPTIRQGTRMHRSPVFLAVAF